MRLNGAARSKAPGNTQRCLIHHPKKTASLEPFGIGGLTFCR
ncbi:hypothetical protein P3T23_002818 [Paraburkholderia sp. GAS448]